MRKYTIYGKNKSSVDKMVEFIKMKSLQSEIEVVYSVQNIMWDISENICIEWICRYDVVNILIKNNKKVNIYFFNQKFISEVTNITHMQKILEEAVLSKDWDTCKDINEFFLFRNVIHKEAVLNSYPMKMQLETTDLCNAKCIMCSHMYNSGTGLNIMDTGLLARIEHILPYLRVMILHGNGEPFLNKNLITYLERVAEYNVKFITNTNMSIINPALLEQIKTNFVELNVSCDGADKEMYETIRAGLNFEEFIGNVKMVRENCPYLRMRMMVVVMRRNLKQMRKLVEFADELGFNEIVFNQLCTDEKNNNLNEAAYLYPEDLRRYTKEALIEGNEREIKVVVPYYFETDKQIDSNVCGESMIEEGICDWLVECPYIDLRGNIGVCCMQQNEIMGNILHQNFDEIWNGHKYINIRKKFWEHDLPSFCMGCDFITQKRLQYLFLSEVGNEILYKKRRG